MILSWKYPVRDVIVSLVPIGIFSFSFSSCASAALTCNSCCKASSEISSIGVLTLSRSGLSSSLRASTSPMPRAFRDVVEDLNRPLNERCQLDFLDKGSVSAAHFRLPESSTTLSGLLCRI